jgi:hypothetical protein
MSVKNFIAANADNDEVNLDREKDLMEDIERLKRDNLKLKEALEYYRRKSPSVKPPPFMLTPQWDEEKVYFDSSKYDEEDQDDTEDDTPPMEEPDHNVMEMENMQSKDAEAEIKAKQLIEFLGASIFAIQVPIFSLLNTISQWPLL